MIKYEPLFKETTHYPPGASLVYLTHPYYIHRDSVSLAMFNDHRFAFYFWSLWAKKRQDPIDLVTLDWHQDLAFPEESQKEELETLDIENTFETSFYSWARLSPLNDDHIASAMYKNIIGDAYVICKQDMDRRNHDEHIIDMYGNTHTIKKFTTPLGAYNYLRNTNIDKVFFDIDLDYFTIENISTNCNQKTSFTKKNEIEQLINSQSDFMWWVLERIQGFTIALEPEFTGGHTKAMKLFCIIEKTLFTGSILKNTTTWRHLKPY